MVSTEPPSAASVREVMTVNPNGPRDLKIRVTDCAKHLAVNGRAPRDER